MVFMDLNTRNYYIEFELTRDDELTRCLYDVLYICSNSYFIYPKRELSWYIKPINNASLEDKLKYKRDNVMSLFCWRSLNISAVILP